MSSESIERFNAPSSAREIERLLDAIEQSIRSLSQPLSPTDTATRIQLVADHGLSYVTALRDRSTRDRLDYERIVKELEARIREVADDADLISRKEAAKAICGTCADDRYGPATRIEGSERLWHHDLRGKWHGPIDLREVEGERNQLRELISKLCDELERTRRERDKWRRKYERIDISD